MFDFITDAKARQLLERVFVLVSAGLLLVGVGALVLGFMDALAVIPQG